MRRRRRSRKRAVGGAGAGGSRADAARKGRAGGPVTVRVDGQELVTESGRTIAGLLLVLGRVSWRTTRGGGRPRGVFCGIGVCHDCLVVVNGAPDVRACQRLAEDGDDIRTQNGAELPA